MKQINLLLLIHRPDTGGLENLVLDYCKLLPKQEGVNVTLFCRDTGGLLNEFLKSGTDVKFIYRKKSFDPSYLRQIRSFIKERSIDIIHTHSMLEAVHAEMAVSFTKCRHVMTYHGHEYFTKSLFVHLLGIVNAHLLDLNIFVSNHLKDFYLDKYYMKNVRCDVLQNGVDAEKIIDCIMAATVKP